MQIFVTFVTGTVLDDDHKELGDEAASMWSVKPRARSLHGGPGPVVHGSSLPILLKITRIIN